MFNLEDLSHEAEKQARAINMAPEEYIKLCKITLEKFTATTPEILNQVLLSSQKIQKKNEEVNRNISMNTRRTYGSF